MRLICPNCAAQYEVDAAMIPSEGRDVQCSSCGNTWFQRPDEAEDALADELGVTERDTSQETPDPAARPVAGPGGQSPGHPSHPSAGGAAPPPDTGPKPRPIDDAAREILREEARREAAARRRDQTGLESQPDLGLDDTGDAGARAAAAKARLAKLRKPDPTEQEDTVESASEIAVSISSASRRELLPDIEEINSTLTATSDRHDSRAEPVDEVQQAEARRGFRTGFFTIFLIVAILSALYVMAPTIAEKVPSAAPAMAGYLDWTNAALDRLDVWLRRTVDGINRLIKSDTAA